MAHTYRTALVLLALAGSPGLAEAQSAMVPWVTRSLDNARSGWNPHETQLTSELVGTRGIVRATIIPLVGDARGMEAQPLILPNVETQRGRRDVMVLPSMANVVRGVDAHDGSGIWETTLGTPINGSQTIDSHNINQHWGCISTGVIDPESRRLYQVCWVSPDKTGNPETARYFMFVLNVSDGSQAIAPVQIEGKSQNQNFDDQMRKQRSSLVETNVDGVKTVLGCSGTIFETAAGAAGFCFAFDVSTNRITTMLATTAGNGAGIWMGGQGIIADPAGDLYVSTGNGDFDGSSQWGESFLKLRYAPPSGGRPATLTVVDHWTPWTDLSRAGNQPMQMGKVAGASAVTEAVKRPAGGGMSMSLKNARLEPTFNTRGDPLVLVFPQMASGEWSDQDLASGSPACLFAIDVCIVAGKDGIGYPVRTSKLGGTTVADFADPKANCANLAAPPVWLTVDVGGRDPCPTDPKTLDFLPDGDTQHLHMTPVQFFDPVLKSWTIFVWGENSRLRKWAVDKSGALSLVGEGHEFASVDVRAEHPGGMPGGFCSGSGNGDDPNSAILVCTIPYGDANAFVVNGRLLVYDPVHLAADGSLKVLWDSQQWAITFLFNKFDPPVIDGGQIYVPNYNGGVDVYRLTPNGN
jgi:hypothetical protein